ncbi:hypothetical protein GP486_007240 [Trichoglossum hirsutum]|uniref:BTB domain-containing protein n=1 Tax=Trichoglossum hirsutum TaxID=265104 RepID=A0A9P8IJL5_9PEZI|nr:hypothetical protein GP486_007240 [Trichoglossum hirsutum]
MTLDAPEEQKQEQPQPQQLQLQDQKPHKEEMKGDVAKTADPNGDVILELSRPDETRVHIRVSSKVLSMASPVFAAMFGSEFKEGLSNHRSSSADGGGAYVVPLPDDDAEAFVAICNVIHFRSDEVPHKPSIVCLQNIAFIADKYDCTKALTAQTAQWLRSWIDAPRPVEWRKLLFVAYVMDTADAFSRISWEILRTQIGPMLSPSELAGHELIHHNLLAEFRVRKSEIDMDVLKSVDGPITRLLGSNCGIGSSSVWRYCRELYGRGMWPLTERLQRMDLVTIFAVLMTFPEMKSDVCGYTRCNFCRGLDFQGELRNMRDRIMNERRGLCLDCVKTEGKSRIEHACRIRHQ